jgi:hypothetical protein
MAKPLEGLKEWHPDPPKENYGDSGWHKAKKDQVIDINGKKTVPYPFRRIAAAHSQHSSVLLTCSQKFSLLMGYTALTVSFFRRTSVAFARPASMSRMASTMSAGSMMFLARTGASSGRRMLPRPAAPPAPRST